MEKSFHKRNSIFSIKNEPLKPVENPFVLDENPSFRNSVDYSNRGLYDYVFVVVIYKEHEHASVLAACRKFEAKFPSTI